MNATENAFSAACTAINGTAKPQPTTCTTSYGTAQVHVKFLDLAVGQVVPQVQPDRAHDHVGGTGTRRTPTVAAELDADGSMASPPKPL
jgi:hypothetical protein